MPKVFCERLSTASVSKVIFARLCFPKGVIILAREIDLSISVRQGRYSVFKSLVSVANQHFCEFEFSTLLSPCRLCVGLHHSNKSDILEKIDSNAVEPTASRTRAHRKRELHEPASLDTLG